MGNIARIIPKTAELVVKRFTAFMLHRTEVVATEWLKVFCDKRRVFWPLKG
jgi:hypothetical protein